MVKLLLVQKFSPIVFGNFRTELRVLEQLEMVQSVGVSDEK
jgi:hypothetical protein